MSRYAYDYQRISFGGPLTPGVKAIIIANMAAFLLTVLIRPFIDWFSLDVTRVLPWNFQLWRVGTYMFLHGSVGHLFWNMVGLFFFGCAVEREWGTRSFYRYYFLCGLGAALFAFIPLEPFWGIPIVGASGAVYGVLLAYGMLFPNSKIYIMLTFPVEAKYVVIFFAFISVASALAGDQGVAHMVHLGGFATGYVLMRWAGITGRRRGAGVGRQSGFVESIKDAYRRYRMKRLRRKFETYYEKRAESDDQTRGNGHDRDIIH